MKTFIIIAILLVISQASKVHEFRAESNFKCTLCTEVLKAVQAQDLTSIETVLEKYPFMSTVIPMLDNLIHDGNKVCEMINFCDDSEEEIELINHQQHIETVNSAQSSWVAGENSKFTNIKKHEIKAMLGTIVDPELTIKAEYILPKDFLSGDVPATFDSRTAFPQCASVIGHVRDQSNCGSCWAHGTTEAFNDRQCIKTGDTTLLSVSDTTGCCAFLNCFSMGCNGGQVATPWAWFKSTGAVTGGDFGDKSSCYPYTMEQCNHHITNPARKECSDVTKVDPTCSKSCSTGNNASYADDKHKSASSYGFSSVDQIKADLVKYGSVTAAFTVYEDFLSYKSGVYKHTSGNALGGHAVKIIGYGEDHWVVVNSWNDSWGDNGTFKIAFGESGIDSQCHAGQV